VNLWSDLAHLAQVPEVYETPKIEAYKPKENLRWWLSDPCGLDQFAVLQGDETEIYWAETLKQPRLITSRSGWTEKYLQWSPNGSYLATIHSPGVKLWAGENWVDMGRKFQHSKVERIEFSPCERFLVTLSPSFKDTDEYIIVWDIESKRKLINFGVPARKTEEILKWSHDGSYFARLGIDEIEIYESSTMQLLDGKPLRLPNIASFDWCPTANYFAAFILSPSENIPSGLVMIEIPTRFELYRTSLFSVKTCELQWQSQGEFLGMKVEKLTKSKKATTTSFEIFSIQNSKNVRRQVISLDDSVRTWSWEPKGKQFGVIHGAEGANRVKVSFFQVSKNTIIPRRTLENKPAKRLFWSPRGSIVIIGGTQQQLEFYSTQLDEIIGTNEHYMATDLQWDPTGRFVCTSVSHWRNNIDNGYTIYTFKGNLVHRFLKDRFYQFLWRPRPPSLLSRDQEKELRKNLPKYAERYKKEDAGNSRVILDEQNLEKQRLFQEYLDMLKHNQEIYNEQRDARAQLRGGIYSDDEEEYEFCSTTVEEVIEEHEEVVEE